MRRSGYILVETVVAMSILSLSILVVHQALDQAITARAQSRDYTSARLLLERKLSEIELQPELRVMERDGRFGPPFQRFSWAWQIEQVDIPMPPPPPDLDIDPELLERMAELFQGHLGKVTITIRWSRAGIAHEAVGQTLLPPEKLWIPNPEEGF